MTDIEIARNTKLENIEEIALKCGLKNNEIENYGKYKAKINEEAFKRLKNKENGKLILVTAMSPTPLGEGKTTVSIAIADGLNQIHKNAVLALREPSLGPVFGIKGGATGGGKVQVAPMEDINLHFTGDIHAITASNNLLSAIIDNHIYFGNELKIKKVTWKRCLDLNDRQLRKVETGLSGEAKIIPREDGFDITVASEIMAILCLAKDIEDLRIKLGNIIIGYNEENLPVYAKDLKAEGAMTVLLKDAINPNLVQTLEKTPCLIHGGPFANIAHGCNSVRATKLALKLGNYVVTEAGFGSDLGAEKFLNIKCREANLNPNAVVIVATIKAIKYHGGALKEDILKENNEALQNGMANLFKHIDNIKNTKILPYIYNMQEVMEVSNLVVARSGAMTVTEIANLEKPAIFIPFPFATENHQEYNAKVLKNVGAAEIILDKDLNYNVLNNTINSLVKDKDKLAQMGKNAGKISKTNVQDVIYKEIKK